MKVKLFFTFTLCTALIACSGNAEKDPGPQTKDRAVPETIASTSVPDTTADMPVPGQDATFEIKTIKHELGWGYDIYMNGSMYVHQPHIPAISGNRGFSSEEKARNTAEFVVYKIRNNIIPPSVTVKELDSLGVFR